MKRMLAAAAGALALTGSVQAQYPYYPQPAYNPYTYVNYLYPGYGAMPAYTYWQPMAAQAPASSKPMPAWTAPAGPSMQPGQPLPADDALLQTGNQEPDKKLPDAKEAPAPVMSTAACHDGCDKPSCLDGCDPCKKGGWYAGAGFYFVQPVWDLNAGTVIVNGGGTGTILSHEFDYSFAPLVWIGYANERGLGGRVRWWHFDAEGGFTEPLAAGQVFTGESRLRLDVLDFEAAQQIGGPRWQLLGSAGVRYADVALDSLITDSLGGSTIQGSNHFQGVGPTGAVEVYRRLGDSRFELYALGRIALLWGEADLAESFGGLGSATGTLDTLRTILEAEVGGRWSRPMGSGRLLLQAALAGQEWIEGGTTGVIGGGPLADFGLFGLLLQAGYER